MDDPDRPDYVVASEWEFILINSEFKHQRLGSKNQYFEYPRGSSSDAACAHTHLSQKVRRKTMGRQDEGKTSVTSCQSQSQWTSRAPEESVRRSSLVRRPPRARGQAESQVSQIQWTSREPEECVMTPRARGQAERQGSQCQSMTSTEKSHSSIYQALSLCTEKSHSSIYQALSLCSFNQYTLSTSYTYYLTLTHPTSQHRHTQHLPLQFLPPILHSSHYTYHLDQFIHDTLINLDQLMNFNHINLDQIILNHIYLEPTCMIWLNWNSSTSTTTRATTLMSPSPSSPGGIFLEERWRNSIDYIVLIIIIIPALKSSYGRTSLYVYICTCVQHVHSRHIRTLL